MSNISSNNKRIAKNTLLLYLRMFLMMGLSLYTSRIVLNVLGVVDYGIYNVVGGVVSMLAFMNGALNTSTQRFLNFEMGRGNILGMHKIFVMSYLTFLLIASEVILPIVKTPLSIASGRSVEVRTETAGKWKKAPSSGTVPESETTQKAFCWSLL